MNWEKSTSFCNNICLKTIEHIPANGECTYRVKEMTAFDTSRSNIVGKSEGKKLLIIVGSMIVVDIMLNDNP